jgi:mannose/fructose/N-acetylgalactosamine-specific phosphotransferase system component IIC
MVSQPLVCGPLFGWLCGQVEAGLLIGGLAQLIWMDVTPVGVGIPYDTTAVTLLATYWATRSNPCTVPQIVLALALAVPFGFLFRWMDHRARRLNTWAARKVEDMSDPYLAKALFAGIVGGLLWSWLRYVVFYAGSIFLGQTIENWITPFLSKPWCDKALETAFVLLPMDGQGEVLELFFSEEPERRFRTRRAQKEVVG